MLQSGGNIQRNSANPDLWDQLLTMQAQCQLILKASRDILATLPVRSGGVPLPVAPAKAPATLAVIELGELGSVCECVCVIGANVVF